MLCSRNSYVPSFELPLSAMMSPVVPVCCDWVDGWMQGKGVWWDSSLSSLSLVPCHAPKFCDLTCACPVFSATIVLCFCASESVGLISGHAYVSVSVFFVERMFVLVGVGNAVGFCMSALSLSLHLVLLLKVSCSFALTLFLWCRTLWGTWDCKSSTRRPRT